MGQLLEVREVLITSQIEVYHFTGDDGYPTAAVFSPVGVVTVCGREFFLPLGVRQRDEEGFVCYSARYDADALRYRIDKAGEINTDYWVEIEKFDFEAEYAPFGPAWEEEQMARRGW